MGRRTLGLALTAGTALAALPALAQAPSPDTRLKPIAVAAQPTPLAENTADAVPDLAPGDDVAIACDAIERVADPSDVRVVLTIAAVPGDSSPGYKKILALNEKVTGSAVHLKVPNAPDLANHTVNLNVYVVDQVHSKDCDAGQYRIVQQPAVAAIKPKG